MSMTKNNTNMCIHQIPNNEGVASNKYSFSITDMIIRYEKYIKDPRNTLAYLPFLGDE